MKIKVRRTDWNERLGGPLLASASCHGALVVASLAWGIFNPAIQLGSPGQSGGGGVVAVSAVPINASRAPVPNPVANPSRHNVPAPPEFRRATEIAPPEAEPEEAAVPEPKTSRREAEQQAERSVGQRSAGEAQANELRSSRGAAVSGEMFRGSKGDLGFGGGDAGPFGKRYGWYAQILQRAIGEQWRKTLGQVAGGASRPVITSFVIHRNGRIGDILVRESSGNRTLDRSAVRAITYASPVRALPSGLGRSSITIEMHFRLG